MTKKTLTAILEKIRKHVGHLCFLYCSITGSNIKERSEFSHEYPEQ